MSMFDGTIRSMILTKLFECEPDVLNAYCRGDYICVSDDGVKIIPKSDTLIEIDKIKPVNTGKE